LIVVGGTLQAGREMGLDPKKRTARGRGHSLHPSAGGVRKMKPMGQGGHGRAHTVKYVAQERKVAAAAS